MITIVMIVVGIVALLGWFVIREACRQHLFLWLPGYLQQRSCNKQAQETARKLGEIHILFCLVDHFEPVSQGTTQEEERVRMQTWLEEYPRLAKRHRDSAGRPPQHTWFYPIENYRSEYLDGLVDLCQQDACARRCNTLWVYTATA